MRAAEQSKSQTADTAPRRAPKNTLTNYPEARRDMGDDILSVLPTHSYYDGHANTNLATRARYKALSITVATLGREPFTTGFMEEEDHM